MISVIIPAYNVEHYIKYSIESVLQQTYQDLELIVVDDGSTDSTYEVCKAVSEREPRIKFVRQENKGVSVARNTGIRAAQGDYIMFVDGDDIISPYCLEHLLNDFGKDAAAVIGDIARIRTYDYAFTNEKPAKQALLGNESLKLLLEGRFPISACATLFRKDCIGKIRFPEKIKHNEDKYFLFQFLMANQNRNIVRTSEKVYGYYVRESSATKVKWNGSTDIVKVADKILSETEKNKPEYIEIAKIAALAARLQILKDIVLAENNQRNNALYKKYRREVLAVGFPEAAGVRTKVMYAALRLGRISFKGLTMLYYKVYSEDRRFKVNELQTSL